MALPNVYPTPASMFSCIEPVKIESFVTAPEEPTPGLSIRMYATAALSPPF
jgi:hypothetical protein